MAMKLLLDINLPCRTSGLLRERGWDCTHASELGFQLAPDEVILQTAREAQAVLVSMDADFGGLLIRAGASGPSLIFLRSGQGLNAHKMADLIERVVDLAERDLAAGAICTVDGSGMRVRRLASE